MATGLARLITGGRRPAASRVRKARTLGGRFLEQGLRVALGDHRLVSHRREDRVVADREDAGQLWLTTTTVAPRLSRQLGMRSLRSFELTGVEPGEGSSKKQDVRIEGHGAREAGALLHATLISEGENSRALEPHERKLQGGDLADLGRREVRVNSRSGSAMFSAASSSSRARRSVQHAEAAHHAVASRARLP